jgi:signal transduction histidine kinase
MIEFVERKIRWPSLSGLDWLITSMRLMWLVSLLFVAGSRDRLSLGVAIVMVLWFGFSIGLPLARAQGWSPKFVRWGGAAIDIVFALALISLSGLFSSPLWSSLLVGVLDAGLSFGLIGSVGIATLGVIASALMGLLLSGAGSWMLIPLGMYVGVIMLAASAIGQIAQQIRWMISEDRPSSDFFPVNADQQRQRFRAILPMVAELNATLNYERVLDMSLEVSANALSDSQPERDQLVGALLMYDGDQLRVVSGRRLTHADWRATLAGEEGLIGEACSTGDPRIGRNPVRDPEIGRLVGFRPCRHLLCIPLRAGLDTYGILLFGSPESDYFGSERVETLEAIAQHAMVALQNARLYRELEQEKERIMQIEEEARNRLARDLHDGPTQSVAALAMRINFARRLMDKDQHAASQELFKVEDLARRTTKEIRHMLFTLRPLILESQGLVVALKQLAEKMQETHSQKVFVEAEAGVMEGLEMAKQGVVFYIVEEAVTNAAKHAQAEHIWVRLRNEEELFFLEVEDDGVGFNVGAVDSDYAQRGSLGMVNMRERAELVNGHFVLESAEGAGTRITVVVPLTEQGAERLRRAGGLTAI